MCKFRKWLWRFRSWFFCSGGACVGS